MRFLVFLLFLKTSSIPFDIFAASFYLLSRYEEYFPHVKDKEGRFQASESLAFQEDFLEQPVIDIWAQKFKKVLQAKFPDQDFPEKKFSSENIIAVTEIFCYKEKGIIRVLLGLLMDVLQIKAEVCAASFSGNAEVKT